MCIADQIFWRTPIGERDLLIYTLNLTKLWMWKVKEKGQILQWKFFIQEFLKALHMTLPIVIINNYATFKLKLSAISAQYLEEFWSQNLTSKGRYQSSFQPSQEHVYSIAKRLSRINKKKSYSSWGFFEDRLRYVLDFGEKDSNHLIEILQKFR